MRVPAHPRHMDPPSPTLTTGDRTFRLRVDGMQRSELERALGELHGDCWGWALACCGRDRDVAEEALQSAYLRVLSGRARFEGGSSFRTFVFGVIRMTAREELRRRRRWTLRVVGADSAEEIGDPAPGADATVEHSERSAALLAALDELSPRQREVLHLVFYHGMTIEQAAAVMHVSLGSARTHYDRGKKALAARLEAGVRE